MVESQIAAAHQPAQKDCNITAILSISHMPRGSDKKVGETVANSSLGATTIQQWPIIASWEEAAH